MSDRRRTIDFSAYDLQESVECLGRYDYARADKPLAQHRHEGAMEICYLAKGRQVYRVAGRDYVLAGGDLFVTFPGEQHSSGRWPEAKGVLYWLIVRTEGDRPFLDHPAPMAADLLKRLLGLPRHASAVSYLTERFDAVFEAHDLKDASIRSLLIRSRLTELLVAIARQATRSPRRPPSDDMNAAVVYIDAHLHEPITVNELAAHMGLSPSWFKAKFRSQIGVSPADYILRRKVEKAAELLASTDKTITQIAYALGFSSSGYFATVYKRYTGRQPRQDRLGDRD